MLVFRHRHGNVRSVVFLDDITFIYTHTVHTPAVGSRFAVKVSDRFCIDSGDVRSLVVVNDERKTEN